MSGGRYTCSEVLNDGGATKVGVVVTLMADFTETEEQVSNTLNCSPDMIGNFTANLIFLALLGASEIPINSGLFVLIKPSLRKEPCGIRAGMWVPSLMKFVPLSTGWLPTRKSRFENIRR
ncbi:MAG: hydantoinase B/oxoprolinase family protein [Deltaproteobacteria bacterium]|nr:hydantoinase B/oxoprolinase family protein [Deltaproteobacteria bacterium]